MKVAVSSSGKNLESLIDTRFGRCAYFLLVKTEDMSFEVFDNPSISLGGSAGIRSAQLISSTGAKAVITGNCRSDVIQSLTAAGIEVFLGNKGIAREVLQKYKNGQLTSTTKVDSSEYSGLGGRTSFGRGRGLGGQRGMAHCRKMGGQRGLGTGRNKA